MEIARDENGMSQSLLLPMDDLIRIKSIIEPTERRVFSLVSDVNSLTIPRIVFSFLFILFAILFASLVAQSTRGYSLKREARARILLENGP